MDYHAYTEGRNYMLRNNNDVSIRNPYTDDLSIDWNKGYFSVWLDFWESDRLIDIEVGVQGVLF